MRINLTQLVPSAAADREGDAPINRGRAFHLTTEKQITTLKKVGLINLDLKKPPESLSGGQQRRLAIAVQLLRSPKVLLLDEPTAGLDWSVRNGIIELLAKLKEKQTILIVTHEPELFKNLNTDNYELHNGQLIPQ